MLNELEILSIDKQIEKYTEKLNTIILKRESRKGKTKVKKLRIPVHLRKFYEEEILKLEKRKHYLLSQKELQCTIGWDNIIFYDGYIRVKINDHYLDQYSFPFSRSSYEFIKPSFFRFNLKPISITIFGSKVIKIENIDDVHLVIQMLSVKEDINNFLKDFESKNISNVLEKLKSISNSKISSFFSINEKTQYLSYLCKIQSNEYRIIPTTEIVTLNQNVVSEEDTFLFTTINSSCCYIIWESTLINKATYIFKSSNISYLNDIQRIFDFIASSQKCKRRKLRYSISMNDNPLSINGVIEHKNFDLWMLKINGIIKNNEYYKI